MRRLLIGIIGIGLLGGLVWLIRRTCVPIGTVREGVPPESETACPAGYPIKGTIRPPDDFIFHVPGEATYDQTLPEICFAAVEDARKAGFEPAALTASSSTGRASAGERTDDHSSGV
ncbi:sunset domain-containing protein [Nitrolancea hollandica]|uniref:Uncharacterized protein n=1 Tax=Nitrolancea hollandica Lb TaxID=1129897 RepID=I4EN46_9BACT|nr:hypothetical protein [Nitrolancea hollandica]CCF86109.1 hypothetical protein NITHO_740001 [Nitrolancea hollandica Lb]